MKYNKPKHIKTDKPKRFKPPEGLNPYKEEILCQKVTERNS